MADARLEYQPGTLIEGTVYRVVKVIGAGGMGTVYDVEDTTVGKRYVLKTLHPDLGGRTDLAKRMEAEARALARLAHSNIVEVVTAGSTKDALNLPFYVMEKLNGENLRSVLHKKGSLELPFALHIGIDLLDALDCAHDQNIFHRDVKPDNIFLHRGANNVTVTKLLDFGISRDTAAPSTTGGRFMGTLRYAAPEQFQGKPVTARTDLYSAALVVYEMIAGRGPFHEYPDGEPVARAHVERQPPWLAELGVTAPQTLEKLLRSALSKDPDKRPKDAFTFAAQLRNLKRQEERPRGSPDSRPTEVALIRGLDQSQPPTPFVEPIITAKSPDAPPHSPVAYAPTIRAQTLASTPDAKSPDTAIGMVPPTVAGTLVSASAPPMPAGGPAPRVGGVDRSAETRSAVMAPLPGLGGPGRGPAGTEPIPSAEVSQPPWARSAVANANPRDTIKEARPAGQAIDPSEIASTQQLLVSLPGGEQRAARTDGASVSTVAPGAERKRSIAIAVVAVTSFAVVATGSLAVALRWHAHAADEATGAPPSFPAPAVPPPTLATPLFDEIPSASAALSPGPGPGPGPAPALSLAPAPALPLAPAPALSLAPAPVASADSASAAAPPKPATAAPAPTEDPRPRPVRPAKTAAAPATAVPVKRHLPGSGL